MKGLLVFVGLVLFGIASVIPEPPKPVKRVLH
jgi:hypothetical protein